tara:strand:+ start:318 stop:467 length:150 start_codon:yes stop_codon:yes gene_type:complete
LKNNPERNIKNKNTKIQVPCCPGWSKYLTVITLKIENKAMEKLIKKKIS